MFVLGQFEKSIAMSVVLYCTVLYCTVLYSTQCFRCWERSDRSPGCSQDWNVSLNYWVSICISTAISASHHDLNAWDVPHRIMRQSTWDGGRREMSVIWDISLVPSSDNLCPLSSHFISKTVFMYFNCIWLVWRWEGEIDNCYIQLLFPGAVLSSDHLTILEKSGVCQWHGNYIIIPLDWNSPQKETEIFSKTKWNLHSAVMVKTTNMHLSLWCRLSGNKSRLAGLAEAFLLCLDITLSQLWRYARSHVKFMFNVDLKD